MKLVYVAGPFTGPNTWAVEQNVRRAEELGLIVAQCGAMPLIPHTNTRFFHGLLTPEFWYEGTLEVLRRCDSIILTTSWETSRGAREEHREAEAKGLRIWKQTDLLNVVGLDSFRNWCQN